MTWKNNILTINQRQLRQLKIQLREKDQKIKDLQDQVTNALRQFDEKQQYLKTVVLDLQSKEKQLAMRQKNVHNIDRFSMLTLVEIGSDSSHSSPEEKRARPSRRLLARCCKHHFQWVNLQQVQMPNEDDKQKMRAIENLLSLFASSGDFSA